MGAVHVHEFMSIDGFFQTPSWTFEYGWASGWASAWVQ